MAGSSKRKSPFVIGKLVARAIARYYPNYVTEVGRFRNTVIDNCQSDWLIADVGCGDHSRLPRPYRFCKKLIGVDIAPAIAENPEIIFKIQGDAYHLPLRDNSVDLVMSCYLWEHLELPENYLGEVARTLRPGGKFIMLTPNRRHYVPLFARITPLWFHKFISSWLRRPHHDVHPTFYRANTPGLLRTAAAKANLRVTELDLFEAKPGYLEWFWPLFMLGVAYERILNRFEILSGLRISMIATMQKAE